MATRNGSYQSNARIEWYYSVGSVNQSTSSVTVTVRAYLRMQGGYSINGNWPVNWWGSWGTSSNTQNMVLGGGQRKQIRSWSQKVTLTDSSQARSLAIRAQHYWGSTQDTLNFSVPARYARTPSNVQVNRISDSNIRVAWTRNSTYSSVVVQRRVNEGSWHTAGVAQGNAQNITLTDGRVNRRYQYRVQGRGGSGNSGYSAPSTYVHTTPVAPLGIAAERAGSGISVSVDNTTPWATRFDVEDSVSGIVATNQSLSALPYLHTDPDPAQPHRYRVRMRAYSGGNEASWLVGPWSAWSNTVQLIQQPNAPTSLSPNGTTSDESLAVRFSWRHNPVDSSTQEQYQLRYRHVGDLIWRTVTGTTAQTRDQIINDPLGNPTGPGEVEWQVRTRGAHPDYSPWSAVATFTLVTAPTVAILEPRSPHRSITVTPEWNYAQEQNRPQSSWQVELRNIDTGALVEARSGSGNVSSVRLNARLTPDTNYLVRVRAATGSIYSDWAEMPFVTEFVPPREPIIEGEWNEESGSYGLTIEDADCTDDGILYQNLVTNPAMESTSGTVEVRRNEVRNPQPTSGSTWVPAGATTTHSTSAEGVNQLEVLHDGEGQNCYVRPSLTATSVEGTWMAFAVEVMPLSQWDADNMRLVMTASGQSTASYPIPVPMGTFTRISAAHYIETTGGALLSYVWPANTSEDRAGFIIRRASVSIGASEETALAEVQEYFDGSTTSPDPDLTASWAGAENASESVLTGLGVANLITGTVEVRRNLNPYPSPSKSSTGWGGRGGVNMVQVPESNATDFRFPESLSNTENITAGYTPATRTPIDAGQSVVVAWDLENLSPHPVDLRHLVILLRDDDTTNWSLSLEVFTLAAGERRVVAYETPSNEQGGTLRMDIRHGASSQDTTTLPDTIIRVHDGLTVEDRSTFAGTTFSGGLPSPDPDLTASWTGAANASESVLTANWTSEPYQITEPDGSKAARFITGAASPIGVPVSSVSTPVGTTRTVLFQVRPSVDIRALPRVGTSTNADLRTIPAGQWTTLRNTATAVSTSTSQTGLLVSGNTPGTLIDIRYAMLTEGEYDGPYHDGDDEGWEWTGTPHGSSSTQVERPPSTSVVIERSVDDGDTWEHVTEARFEDCSLSVSDFEGLSCGTTLYRVTNSAATGASIEVVHEGLADSEAIWLGTGEGFSQTARLSLHDGIGIRRGRQRSLEQYQGRSLGVAYMSENLHRTISVQGMVPDEDRLRCPSATRDELDDVILAPYPVHLHRDMHGNRVYGIVPEVDNDREWLMRHEDCGEHQGMCRQGLWSFGYSLDETESR